MCSEACVRSVSQRTERPGWLTRAFRLGSEPRALLTADCEETTRYLLDNHKHKISYLLIMRKSELIKNRGISMHGASYPSSWGARVQF